MRFIMADRRVSAESHKDSQKLPSTGVKFKKEVFKTTKTRPESFERDRWNRRDY